ncbi:MAG: hypothetical protein CSA83_01065 [Actinomycetales bacterium]|nr:MAG: hypothetical protein CSA83_01065 [Actinomycetales bacterium]
MNKDVPLPKVRIDEAWLDLRYHLEWTKGRGTVVFVAVSSRDQVQDLRSRANLFASRLDLPWTEPPEEELPQWLAKNLPIPGVLWLDLWSKNNREKVLRELNELRSRLAGNGAGCLVLCGPTALLAEAANEAVDLWSIRSLAQVVSLAGVPGDEDEILRTDLENLKVDVDSYSSAWSVILPTEMRDTETSALLRDVDTARRILGTDPIAARNFVEASPHRRSELGQILFSLVLAEAAGLLDDVESVQVYLSRCLDLSAEFPYSFRSQICDAALQIGITFGAIDVATRVGDYLLSIYRDSAEVLGTPQSRRDLAYALNNAGDVARLRGDLDVAGQVYGESLDICRDLVVLLGTPQSRRDLAYALNSVGNVAFDRGDLDVAGQVYGESLDICRDLVRVLGTPQSRRDLSVSLDSVIKVEEKLGNTNRVADLLAEKAALQDHS